MAVIAGDGRFAALTSSSVTSSDAKGGRMEPSGASRALLEARSRQLVFAGVEEELEYSSSEISASGSSNGKGSLYSEFLRQYNSLPSASLEVKKCGTLE